MLSASDMTPSAVSRATIECNRGAHASADRFDGGRDTASSFKVMIKAEREWWTMLGLNQRPVACEATALPLS